MTESIDYETLFKCLNLLEALVGPKLMVQWWESPNRAFEGRTPLEQFKRDPHSVLAYLNIHTYGGW